MIRSVTRFSACAALGILTLAFAGCGGDDPKDPPPPGKDQPVISSFTASEQTVAPGAKVVLSWTVEKANTVSISAEPGGSLVQGSTQLTGTVETGEIRQRTTFTLTAVGDGGSKTQTVTVDVDANAVTIEELRANPNPAPQGGETTVSWRTVNATQVRLLRDNVEIFSSTDAGDVASGTFDLTVDAATINLVLIASNDAQQAMRNLTVQGVLPANILDFRVNPNVFTGASAMISVTWRTENATMVTLTANGMAVPNFTGAATGTISVNVTEATRFELIASSPVGDDRAVQAVARAVPEVEPNDDANSATPIMGGAQGELTMGDLDYYAFDVPAGGNVYIETSDGMGGCAVDTVVTLIGPDGMPIAEDDDGGNAPCSRLDPQVDGGLSDLPAGRYLVVVQGFDADELGPYALLVLVEGARCGNGILEQTTNEVCDDGNTAAGDGCGPTCTLEIQDTINGFADRTFTGMLVANGAAIYEINLTEAGYIRAESFVPAAPSCTGADTVMYLIDDQSRLIGSDDNDGAEDCSLIDPVRDSFAALEPGKYYLILTGRSAAPIGAYSLVVRTLGPGCGNGITEETEQCDDGNTAANDGCTAACAYEIRDTMTAPGDRTFTGNLGAGQVAAYEIVLNEPGYVRAETFIPVEGQCMGTYDDTILVLAQADGTRLGSDDDDGLETCSRIDPARDGFAALEAGRYLLIVTPFTATEALGAFTLVVNTFGRGCGNTVLEMGEQCDDGNTMSNDGCNNQCRLEPAQTFNPPSGNATFNLAAGGSFTAFAINIGTAGQSITATVTASNGMGCGPGTEMRLLDSTGALLGEGFGFGGDCTTFDLRFDTFATDLATGQYLLVVERTGTSTTPASYRIDVGIVAPRCGNGLLTTRSNEQCDDGNTTPGDGCNATCRFEGNVRNEVEPNDMTAQATPTTATPGGAVVSFAASINPAGDVDHYAITVPAGQMATLSATTYDILGQPADMNNCGSNDTIMTLLDSAGMELEESDDEGPGLCSQLTGVMLSAGTYYLRVIEYGENEVISRYFLDVQLQ